MNHNAPWLKYYGDVPKTLSYPKGSMYDLIEETAEKYADNCAYDFMGKTTTYGEMMGEIKRCAKAFSALGIHEGDRVTICLPNMPQTVACFYALNLMGAVANMVHPLSSENEIIFYIEDSSSVAVVTLDSFYEKFESIRDKIHIKKLIVASVKDALGGIKKFGYALTEGLKIPHIPKLDPGILLWKDFLSAGEGFKGEYNANRKSGDPAAILYSGGTTGKTKGILLSNLNFNALALQTSAMGKCLEPGKSMLAVMPMFHGFGLGVCIHTMLSGGCECILVPRFNAKSYAELIKKKQPNYIAGVPTLYEAILRNPDMEGVDLSCLMGVFSGGDSLSIELKRKFDQFLKDHNATVQIREGYGTTECVTASCLTPYNTARTGSIGLPFPDTYYKIVGGKQH